MRMLIEEILPIMPPAALSCEHDVFRSALIVCFEEAVERGLAPKDAIAIVLDWVAGECARLKASSS